MKIVKAFPPNIEAIKAKFKIDKYTVFTYGDTLYNPGGWNLSDNLIEHEQVHVVQQGSDPKAWWDEYLRNPQFRLENEVEAYRQQYKTLCLTANRAERRTFLKTIAHDLAGPIYGNIIDFQSAQDIIKS